ncbi:Sterol-4-alpha-carboxylate 3-dehydrogenase, decarboxylating [Cytospora mali]|uniref:Sterol-4-alpha-carboxylate 3-dehydrogenase, decarboxylating n=1 Tax=Cytospora mali TaxID=578113 RepID=A0A194UR78_CYTMA|nr:Sterol-4-alpha-carboxylate 3-dehydrogenase, decarboxylating [Valsa mali var. pyri (nom. inval.)]
MDIDALNVYSAVFAASIIALLSLTLLYLVNLNRLLSSTPEEVKKLVGRRWTQTEIKETYKRLCCQPITTSSYASQIPSKLNRRYIVTGGSGIVGGYIVLQLLARGQPPHSIRIVDFQEPHRTDHLAHPGFSRVNFQKTDISSAASTQAAFSVPWDPSVAGLPLTVFHTAAVIIPSARSELVNGFCESVNVGGTQNVLAAARKAGAHVLISTSSASISIRPVELWINPWKWNTYPRHYWQLLEESDFFRPIRRHANFYGNYPASKAKAERIVCGANSKELRTGCIRPANGVYGHPTDNTVGGPWAIHVVQSFVHGINCALAHLQFEAILADPASHSSPQAGRPFCVTDPNPPIYYRDLYSLVSQLTTTPFRILELPPLPMLLLSYCIEFYSLLPARFPLLARYLRPLSGDVKHLQPGLFSICTHLVANNSVISKPVEQGGLGYRGVLTTLDGMCQELFDWNKEQEEHAKKDVAPAKNSSGRTAPKWYRNSVSLAEEIQKLGEVGKMITV